MEQAKMVSRELARDFVRPLDEAYYVNEQDTVREALSFMDKARQDGKPLCLFVVEKAPPEKGVIKGYVTPRELVFGLTTRFLRGAEKSGPIFWEGQFESECRDGMDKRVGEIMSPIRAYVRDSEMLMEAVFLLHKYEQDFLLTINKEEEVVGSIHLDEILRHISTLVDKRADVKKRIKREESII